jgi:hypothetical protein
LVCYHGGYWLATSAGNVYQFNAPFYGSKAGRKLPSPVAGIAADGAGYLLVTKAGNVYPFNTAFYGSKAGQKLPAPVIGITRRANRPGPARSGRCARSRGARR